MLMKKQASNNPQEPMRKAPPKKVEKVSNIEKASPLNRVVRTTKLKGTSPKSLKITGQRTLKSFLERNQMEHSALVFQNSGIQNIRDQRSNVLCDDASDLKTTEASNLMDSSAHQLQNTATEKQRNL